MDKNIQVKSFDEVMTSPTPNADEGLRKQLTSIFLSREYVLNINELKEINDDTQFQLVKVRCKKDLYGIRIKSYTDKSIKYALIKLQPNSVTVVKELYPDWLFTNKYFDPSDSGVIVMEEHIEPITTNLVFMENSSVIDESCIFKEEKCTCTKNEYAKIRNGRSKEIVLIQNCLKINNQHCLKIKYLEGDTAGKYSYFHAEDVIRKGLQHMTKYFEGVIIDPGSFVTMVKTDFTHMKIGDQVSVMLRDSSREFKFRVVGLGKVNDVDVAAVKPLTSINNSGFENLLFNGTFKNIEFCNSPAYIVVLSSIKKLHLEMIITPTKMNEIAKLLKNNQLSNELLIELQIIKDNIRSILTFSTDCCHSILKLCTVVLKQLKRDMISKKSVTGATPGCTVLQNGSMVVLDTICVICSTSNEFVNKVAHNSTLIEHINYLFNERINISDSDDNKNAMLSNVMFILWHVIKTDNTTDTALSEINEIFTTNHSNPELKLSAALIMCFLITKELNIVPSVLEYLRLSYQNFDKGTNGRYCKNDILISIGKLAQLCDLSVKSESRSDQCGKVSRQRTLRAVEESCTVETPLLGEEYEDCIDKLIDNQPQYSEHIINHLDRMKPRGLLLKYIKKSDTIDLIQCRDLVENNCRDVEMIKAILDVGKVDPSQYKSLIGIAESLFVESKFSSIQLILSKIERGAGESIDNELLSFACTCVHYGEMALFKVIVSKCGDINSSVDGTDTFVTYIIKQNLEEQRIIAAIKDGGFDITKKNLDGKSPISLAITMKMKELYTYLIENGADLKDVFDTFHSLD